MGVFSHGKSTTIYSAFFHLARSSHFTPSSPSPHPSPYRRLAFIHCLADPTGRNSCTPLLSYQYTTFTSATTHRRRLHSPINPLQSRKVYRFCPLDNDTSGISSSSIDYRTTRTSKQLDTRGARSARRQEIGLVNIQSGIGLCSLNFNCASISFSGETPDSNPLLTRGSFT